MKIFYSQEGREVSRSVANDKVYLGRGRGDGTPHIDLSPDIYVSRRHAQLIERDGTIWIEDLGSKHGTSVNGKQIEGECLLRPDDIVGIGETTLRVQLSLEQPLAPPVLSPAKADAVSQLQVVVIVKGATLFESKPD